MLGLDLGDIGHPLGFRLQREKIAFKQVDHARRRYGRAATRPATLPPGPALQAVGRHQARDPVQAGTFALLSQVFAHATSPQRTAAVFVQFAHPYHQALIVDLSGARRALAPRVVAAGRYLQAPAHQPDRKLIAATFDHLIPQDDPFAKNIAASRKKFRSFFTRASSRLRRANSSSRGVPVPPKAIAPGFCASRFQRVSRVSRIPNSRAT
ncbi:hypothetical protein D3C81_1654180 [compost metagenome]